MPLWLNTKYIKNKHKKTKNYISITNSHGQVKPRITEKREMLQGESWLLYLKEEKKKREGGGGNWYALKLIAPNNRTKLLNT